MDCNANNDAEKFENLRTLIKEGLQDMKAGNVEDGKIAFQKLREHINSSQQTASE